MSSPSMRVDEVHLMQRPCPVTASRELLQDEPLTSPAKRTAERRRGATGLVTRNPLVSTLERPTGFEPATSSLGSWHSATELRPPGGAYSTTDVPPLLAVLEGHVVGLDQLVAARFPVEPLGGTVEVELLVERHGSGVLDPELVDLLVLGQALLLIHDRLRLVEEAIKLGVEIGRASCRERG